MDKDTLKAEQDQERVHDFVKSDGWQFVKDRLQEHLTLMNSISTMNFIGLTAEQIAVEAESRANTVVTITNWINEIEGIASTFNRQVIQHPKDNIFINLDQ